MDIVIFRGGSPVVTVKPDSSSELLQTKQLTDTVTLNFRLSEPVQINTGDYIVYDKRGVSGGGSVPPSVKYVLRKPHKRTDSPNDYRYECVFEGEMHALDNTVCLLTTNKADGSHYTDYKFPITGNAKTFLSFIVGNLNRTGGQYSAGVYKDTATITAEFNQWTVTEALAYLSENLGISWRLDNGTLHFDDVHNSSALTLQLGRLGGLVSVTRDRITSKNIETVVWGYGSTDNLPPRSAASGATYDSSVLSENRLAFAGDGGESKLSKNTDVYGIREAVKEFDDIKPEYTGSVTALNATDVMQFTDTNVPFDINSYLLSGINPKITFLDGLCIGFTFGITYQASTSTYLLQAYADERGSYPNDLIKPAIGDTYKLFDIAFPEVYITEAQERLRQATQDYLDTASRPLEAYSAVLDERFMQGNNVTLYIGDYIRISVPSFGLDGIFEIKELTQKITEPYKYQIKFGDILPINLIAQLKMRNFTVNNAIYKVSRSQITSNNVTNIVGDTLVWL